MATKLDVADAQFVGFFHGKWKHNDVVSLVEEMGLTNAEWKKWEKVYVNALLTEEEIAEIDTYFMELKKKKAKV